MVQIGYWEKKLKQSKSKKNKN